MGWRSHSYAVRLVRAGYIPLVSGRVDPVAAKAQLEAAGVGAMNPGLALHHQLARTGVAAPRGPATAGTPAGGRPRPRRQATSMADEIDELVSLCKLRCTIQIDALAESLLALKEQEDDQ